MIWGSSKRYGNFFLARSPRLKSLLIATILLVTLCSPGLYAGVSTNDALVKENINLQATVIEYEAENKAKDSIITDKDKQIDRLTNKLGKDSFGDLVSNVTWFILGVAAKALL